MNENTTIYVAGFVTDGGTGGYEWDTDRSRIDTLRAEWIAAGDADVSDVETLALGQLALDRNYTNEAITDALNAMPDAWEPTQGQNR